MEEAKGPEFDPTLSADQQPAAPVAPVAPVVVAPAPDPVPSKDIGDIRAYNIPGVTERPLGGVSLSAEALLVKEKLAKEARMPFFIPLDQGETKGAYRSVTINGYRCEVKKNVMTNLPISIVRILMESMQMESEALHGNERNLDNADAATRSALGLQ